MFGVCCVLFGVHYIFLLCILRRNWCLWHWDVVFLTFRIRDGLSNSSITKNVYIWVFNLWINFPKSSPFRVLCGKRYAGLKKVHHPRLWGLWQLSGMSKCFDKLMQSHTGCICLIFLHGVFLYDPSNNPLERRYIHTCGIFEPSCHHKGNFFHDCCPSLLQFDTPSLVASV